MNRQRRLPSLLVVVGELAEFTGIEPNLPGHLDMGVEQVKALPGVYPHLPFRGRPLSLAHADQPMTQPSENSNRLFPSQEGDGTPGGGKTPDSAACFWAAFLATWRTERTGPIPGSLPSSILLILLLAPIYFGVGQIAFSMEVGGFNITSQVFFPEGVALIFVILFGSRVAPGIILGQLVLAHAAGLPILACAMTGLVDTGAVILSGYLFWRWRISPHLDRPREMALLVMLCALVASAHQRHRWCPRPLFFPRPSG